MEDINKVIRLDLLQAGPLLVPQCSNLAMDMFSLAHTLVHPPNITHLNNLTLATLLNLPLLDMPLAGIRLLPKINNLRELVMITTTSRPHHSSNKLLEAQLLQLIIVPMVTTSNQPRVTAKDKLIPKMAMVDIMHLHLNLVIRALVMSSNRVIALQLVMGMPQTQHQMARILHMVHKAMGVKHLHQFSHQPRANKVVTHLRALLRQAMGCHQLLKVGMGHRHLQAMLRAMGPHRLKSLLLVSQLMVSHSSLLARKVVMPSLPQHSLGIHNQLLNQAMLSLILALSDLLLLAMVLQQLSLVMVPHLMGLHLVMASSSHHLTTVPMLVVTPSLQRMLLMAQLLCPSLFSLVVGLQKHHLKVNVSQLCEVEWIC